jgi:uncharacterized integral membrane protein
MGNLWLRIKIWFKVTLVAALFVYVVLFTYYNASEKAHFWYWFRHQPETTLLLLVLSSFVAGIIASMLVRTTFRTVRQIQELQQRARTERLGREVADMQTKAAMLQTKPTANPANPDDTPNLNRKL